MYTESNVLIAVWLIHVHFRLLLYVCNVYNVDIGDTYLFPVWVVLKQQPSA